MYLKILFMICLNILLFNTIVLQEYSSGKSQYDFNKSELISIYKFNIDYNITAKFGIRILFY